MTPTRVERGISGLKVRCSTPCATRTLDEALAYVVYKSDAQKPARPSFQLITGGRMRCGKGNELWQKRECAVVNAESAVANAREVWKGGMRGGMGE